MRRSVAVVGGEIKDKKEASSPESGTRGVPAAPRRLGPVAGPRLQFGDRQHVLLRRVGHPPHLLRAPSDVPVEWLKKRVNK